MKKQIVILIILFLVLSPDAAQPSHRLWFALLGVAAATILFLAWVLIWGRKKDED